MAFGVPDVWSDKPLMYQGMSHRFLSADGVVSFPSADDQIDFEGEFGVIIGPLPMGASTEQCAGAIRLITQINDWSLRLYSREEAMRGFGRSEEHTSELQSLMRISYAVFCLKKKKQ